MRVLFLVFLSIGLFQVASAEPLRDTTAQIAGFRFDPRSSLVDWRSKDVRIEKVGNCVRIVFRCKTYKGPRRISVSYGIDQSNSSVTLIYGISVFVGPITSKGLNFEQGDAEIIWVFKDAKFEELRRKNRFYIECVGKCAVIG